jgi:hypothetical protein
MPLLAGLRPARHALRKSMPSPGSEECAWPCHKARPEAAMERTAAEAGGAFTRGRAERLPRVVDRMDIGQSPMQLVQVEAVAHEELVGDREADVAERQVLDEAAVRAV